MAKLPGQNKIPRAKASRGLQPQKLQIIPPTDSTNITSRGIQNISGAMKAFSDKITEVDALRQTTETKAKLQKEINAIKVNAVKEQDPDAITTYQKQINEAVERSTLGIRGLETNARVGALTKQMGVAADWDLQNAFYSKKIKSAEAALKNMEVSQHDNIVNSNNRDSEKVIMFGSFDDTAVVMGKSKEQVLNEKRIWGNNVAKSIFLFDVRNAGVDYALAKLDGKDKEGNIIPSYDDLWEDILEKDEHIFSEQERKDLISKANSHAAAAKTMKDRRIKEYQLKNIDHYAAMADDHPEDFLHTDLLDTLVSTNELDEHGKNFINAIVEYDAYTFSKDSSLRSAWFRSNPIVTEPDEERGGRKFKKIKGTGVLDFMTSVGTSPLGIFNLKKFFDKHDRLLKWQNEGISLLKAGAITKEEFRTETRNGAFKVDEAYESKYRIYGSTVRNLHERGMMQTDDPEIIAELSVTFANLWQRDIDDPETDFPDPERVQELADKAWEIVSLSTGTVPYYSNREHHAVMSNALNVFRNKLSGATFKKIFKKMEARETALGKLAKEEETNAESGK